MILSLVNDHEEVRQYTRDVGLLSYDVIFLKVSYGLALYTVTNLQVNVNLLVPMDPLFSVELVRQVEQYISGIYADHTISLVPLRTHVPELSVADFVKRRRFVPSRIYISKLTIAKHDNLVLQCSGQEIKALHRIECQREVAKYRPLSTMNVDDDIAIIYWHKFACGSILVFTNPFVDVVEALPFPEPFYKSDRTMLSQHMDVELCRFVYALAPSKLSETLHVVSQKWIPPGIRDLCLCSGVSSFGITDEVVLAVGESMDDKLAMSQFAIDLTHTYKIIQMASTLSDTNMCEMLVTMMRKLDDDPTWRKWICESTLLWTCVVRIPCSFLSTMLKRADMELLRVLCIRLLHHRIYEWTSEEKERVGVLCQVMNECSLEPPRKCVAEARAVRQAFEQLNVSAHEIGVILADKIDMSRDNESATRSNSHHRSTPKKSGDGVVSSKKQMKTKMYLQANDKTRAHGTIRITALSECRAVLCDNATWSVNGSLRTHLPLVQRMKQRFPSLDFELIGSGIFSNTGDVDVVVSVCGNTTNTASGTIMSLSEAYEHVRLMTGWVPNYHKVDGSHVSVLCGTFEGVAVDAQVWRGEKYATSPSELLTQNALRFAQKLSAEANVAAVSAAKWMHAFCDVAGLKSHKLCRLPGVGVTCAAIALTCGNQAWNPRALLTSLRECLSSEMPLIDFDALRVDVDTTASRCTVPLTIMLNELNCCNRMTAATTRHMVNVIAYALGRGLDVGFGDKIAYAEWRKHNMVVCTRMQPLSKTSVTYSLLSVAASLERHPMIDTLYFADDDSLNYNSSSRVCANEESALSMNQDENSHESTLKHQCSDVHLPVITVLCTLRPDADVDIYGFRRDDRIQHVRETTVVVERNKRTITLALSPRRATKCCVRTATRICDMICVDGMPENMSFPNAVSLTCDVTSLFDRKLWTPCLPSS